MKLLLVTDKHQMSKFNNDSLNTGIPEVNYLTWTPMPNEFYLLYPDITTVWPEYWFDTNCAFASYKGIHWVDTRKIDERPNIKFAVVHTNSEKQNKTNNRKLVFVPLHFGRKIFKDPSESSYVFIGGRKDRDWQVVVDACESVSLPYVVCSDLYRGEVGPHCLARYDRRVEIEQYQSLIHHSRVTAVPLHKGNHSHGHSDVVRGILGMSAVAVTAGASCDDYVQYGATLVPHNTVGEWSKVLSKLWLEQPNMATRAHGVQSLNIKHYLGKVATMCRWYL